MALVQIDWHPDAKGLRSFGLVMIVGFGAIALGFEFALDNRTAALAALFIGGGLGLLGLTGTVLALPGYWLWMGLAFVMGNVMGRVLVAAFYYGVITPLGLAMRLFGRDELQLRNTRTSYWSDLPPPSDRARYERQF